MADSKTAILGGVSVNFRYVPAGSFQRDEAAENVSVISKGYWMAETETTQELFQAVMGVNPGYFDGTGGGDKAAHAGETQAKRPVENVNWYHAIAFCNKLSIANGQEAVYSVKAGGTEIDWASLSYAQIPTTEDSGWNGVTMDRNKNGYRLPTEMEWMWAAMGADKTAQPNTTGYGKAFAGSNGSNSIDEYAWYTTNSGGKTHEAGKKTANELGLKDMSGNLWEWCWDWFGGTNGADGTVADSGELIDYPGAALGSYRVLRGGWWGYNASFCTVALRGGGPAGLGGSLGFRFACPLS